MKKGGTGTRESGPGEGTGAGLLDNVTPGRGWLDWAQPRVALECVALSLPASCGFPVGPAPSAVHKRTRGRRCHKGACSRAENAGC